jgi:hypothetical protein
MSVLSAETWQRLSADRVTGDLLRARRATPNSGERLLAALDTEGRRHLLVLLTSAEAGFEDRQSRGVSVTTREFALPQHTSGRYLDVVCLDASGHEAFDVIGGEIADRILISQQPTTEMVAQVLAKWRRFWSLQPRALLSREEQIGLFAEIWFLTEWLIPKTGPREAVARWRGPLAARHDFEWRGRSVEVKATASARGRIHCIHGLDQLQPPESGDLLFFSLRLREEGGASQTLPGIVATCRMLLKSDAAASDGFDYLLASAGYSPAHEADYAESRWFVVEEGLFRVDGDFPRLTTASFTGGIPAGIERIEYEVNLAVAGAHLLATSSAQIDEL